MNEQKQAFSIAYARAVAAVAGYAVHRPESDYDSIDLGISAGGELPQRPRIEVQLKGSSDDVLGDDDFAFWLKKKNYDDLRVSEVAKAKAALDRAVELATTRTAR
jgi:hypothetical protein